MKHGKKLGMALTRFRERQALRAQIEQTRHSIDSARNHFEQVVDPTLIDCYIYELNAAQLRYQFLLRKFKNLEVDA
ncbi:MAG: YaaL family protein [Hungatella sp.]|nr:YaaL family protein [Hungatella sp.]